MGKRRFFAGVQDRDDTLRMALRLEDDHRQVRLGYRPEKAKTDRFRTRPYSEIATDYLKWGCAQGGRGGRPWSEGHASRRRFQVAWWQEQLSLETLADLDGVLPGVERVAQEMLAAGKAGKTVANEIEALRAFCKWCLTRKYLKEDPLAGLAPFDTTPQTLRRAMTRNEVSTLLSVTPPERRLLYETTFVTGLRANELRSLTLAHIDMDKGGLHLEASWTKNRKAGFQPLPLGLLHRLRDYAESGEPSRLYERAFRRGGSKRRPPDRALLYVPSHTARSLYRDLEAAGIPRNTPKGKLDFHATRVAFINFLIENGDVTPKELQELARHSSIDMSWNVYGRPSEERARDAVEKLSAITETVIESVPSVHRVAVGQNEKSATPVDTGSCASIELAPALGLEPRTCWLTASRSAN